MFLGDFMTISLILSIYNKKYSYILVFILEKNTYFNANKN